MKKIIISLVLAMMAFTMNAQTALNSKADSILGSYESIQGGEGYKVKVTKNSDGSYKAQIFWISDPLDKKGNKRYDEKNPDKSLRNVPSDQIVLFNGLKYNSESKLWDGTKIYDPQRGLKANVSASFQEDGRLRLRGKVGPIVENVYWTRIK